MATMQQLLDCQPGALSQVAAQLQTARTAITTAQDAFRAAMDVATRRWTASRE